MEQLIIDWYFIQIPLGHAILYGVGMIVSFYAGIKVTLFIKK